MSTKRAAHKIRLREIAKVQPLVRPVKRDRTPQENRRRKAYLYALFDERAPERLAYIGCTEHLRYRFTAYYSDNLSPQPPRLREWLESVGHHLSAKVLAVIPFVDRLETESAMIRECLKTGHPLLNSCYRGQPTVRSTRKRSKKVKKIKKQRRVKIAPDVYERNRKYLATRSIARTRQSSL